MRMRDLTREGRPAFPPVWQDPYTGAKPLQSDPEAGIVVGAEWARPSLSLELTLYWRATRLVGTLVTDDATVLSRVYDLLCDRIPVHVDELLDTEIPPALDRPGNPPRSEPAAAGVSSAPEPRSEDLPPLRLPGIHPDVARLVRALLARGVLSPADIEAAWREDPPQSLPVAASTKRPAPARTTQLFEAASEIESAGPRLVPRK